ncbi:pyridoxamine 5'-phosphate oxidase family protein [Nonomuraea sp. NPDC050556]|uniref:pyridoxamine 5'-phosphate oxidase family protein n=1 Tax=Nonomuraea sp. NPDC050556 TaxID=3364369 RepID=UPI0037B6C398
MSADPAGQRVLSVSECLALLTTTRIGRLVFTEQALPAVRPLTFAFDTGAVVVRRAAWSPPVSLDGMIVAFEVDELDPQTGSGWFVTVVGRARVEAAEIVISADRVEGRRA